MPSDISTILDEWPYDPESNLRFVTDADGREKLQIRVQEGAFRGVLQMELDGRPDGGRPHGCAFALDHYEQRQRQQAQAHPERPFRLDQRACKELFAESHSVYERYALLLHLSDFRRVLRDTEHNMRLFRFVNRHARRQDDQQHLERWWPYILRIHATARAMLALPGGDAEEALAAIQQTRRQILNLPEVDAAEFHVEKERSLQTLKEFEEKLLAHDQPSPRRRLEQQLREAVRREAFERAADIRDRLREMPPENVGES